MSVMGLQRTKKKIAKTESFGRGKVEHYVDAHT